MGVDVREFPPARTLDLLSVYADSGVTGDAFLAAARGNPPESFTFVRLLGPTASLDNPLDNMLTKLNRWFYNEVLGLKLNPMTLTRVRGTPGATKTVSQTLLPNRKAITGLIIASILVLVVINVAQSLDRQKTDREWAAKTPELQAAIISRVRYRDAMNAAANALGITFGLTGKDSTTLTAVFDASIDQNVIEGYLEGASRPGYPMADAVLRQSKFTAVRIGDNFQGVWERRVGDPTVRTLSASTRSVTAPAVSQERRINGRAPLFVSKEAMHVGMKMILQGMTDSDLLAPYVSCVANEGDRFISINGSWTVSEVMITDGPNRGCQGWIPNEYITK